MNTHDIELPEPKYPGTKLDIPNAIPDLYTAEQVIAAIEADRKRGTAKQRYDSAMEGSMEADPIEQLRFYCSLAMSGQDWLDVERFFDKVVDDRQGRGEPVAWPNGCDRTVPQALRYLADYDRPSGGSDHFNSEHLFQLADEIEQMARQPLFAAPHPAEPVKCGNDYKDNTDFHVRASLLELDAWQRGWNECEAMQDAEPVKVPSDDEIEALVRKTASDVFGIGDEAYDQDDREFYGRFARALLAHYGNQEKSNG